MNSLPQIFHADAFSSRVTLNFILLKDGWSTEILVPPRVHTSLPEPPSGSLDISSLDPVPPSWWSYLYFRFHPLLLPPEQLENAGDKICFDLKAKTLQQFPADTIHRGPGGRGRERLLLFWVTKPRQNFYDPFQYVSTFEGYPYVENTQLIPTVLARYLYGVNSFAFHSNAAMWFDRRPWSYLGDSTAFVEQIRKETVQELKERIREIEELNPKTKPNPKRRKKNKYTK